MKAKAQTAILGIDVARDHLDGFFLSDGERFWLANTSEGHAQLIELLALHPDVVVCFEVASGQEWRLWVALDAAGIATCQLPTQPLRDCRQSPAGQRIEAFAASRGMRAKTDRIDAELIACFMEFCPDAGRWRMKSYAFSER